MNLHYKSIGCALVAVAIIGCGDDGHRKGQDLHNSCPESVISGRKKMEDTDSQLSQKNKDIQTLVNKFGADWKNDLKPETKLEKDKATKIKNDLKVIQLGISSLLDDVKLLSTECDQFVKNNEKHSGCTIGTSTIWNSTIEDIKSCGNFKRAINKLENNKKDFDQLEKVIDQRTAI